MKKHLWNGTCVVVFNSGDIPGVPLTGASTGEFVFAKVNSLRVVTYEASAASRRSCAEAFDEVRKFWASYPRAAESYCTEITSFTTSYKKVY